MDGTPFFVRIPGADTELLAVDRGNEIHNTIAAAEAGVAPRVVQTVPGVGRLRRSSGSMRGRCRTRALRAAGMPSGSRRSCGSSTPGRGSATTSTCSASPSGTWRSSTSATSPIPAGYREHLGAAPADRGRARRPSAADRPVPQRPARRELPRRRRAPVARRLGVQRQQRPDVRARQHGPGARLRRRPGRGAVRRLLRRGLPCPARPDAPPDDHVRRRLDALGRHPGPHLDHRLRLHRLGRGTLGASGGGARRAGLRVMARDPAPTRPNRRP